MGLELAALAVATAPLEWALVADASPFKDANDVIARQRSTDSTARLLDAEQAKGDWAPVPQEADPWEWLSTKFSFDSGCLAYKSE